MRSAEHQWLASINQEAAAELSPGNNRTTLLLAFEDKTMQGTR